MRGFLIAALTSTAMWITVTPELAQAVDPAIVQTPPATATPLRLGFPESGALSRPIIEFRGRAAKLPDHAGHVFVLFGRQLADNTIIYYGAGGFYPAHDTFKAYLKSPGHVDYTDADIQSDITFQVKITGDQEHLVQFILANWNEKEYKVFSQNCISLIKSVGKALGLEVGDPKGMDVIPYDLVRLMKNENDSDAPLRHAVIEGKRAQENLSKDRAVIRDITIYQIKHAAEVQQSRDAYDRWQQSAGSIGEGIPLSFSGGESKSPFSSDSIMSYTWPWKPPTSTVP
jgi:hypothetical protein